MDPVFRNRSFRAALFFRAGERHHHRADVAGGPEDGAGGWQHAAEESAAAVDTFSGVQPVAAVVQPGGRGVRAGCDAGAVLELELAAGDVVQRTLALAGLPCHYIHSRLYTGVDGADPAGPSGVVFAGKPA